MEDATLYDPVDSSVGGTHAIFILRGEARTFNLPPAPDVPTVYLKKSWGSSALAAGLLLGGALLAFLAEGRLKRG
jgi:formate dehydrogenase iron-sulfur subunit